MPGWQVRVPPSVAHGQSAPAELTNRFAIKNRAKVFSKIIFLFDDDNLGTTKNE